MLQVIPRVVVGQAVVGQYPLMSAEQREAFGFYRHRHRVVTTNPERGWRHDEFQFGSVDIATFTRKMKTAISAAQLPRFSRGFWGLINFQFPTEKLARQAQMVAWSSIRCRRSSWHYSAELLSNRGYDPQPKDKQTLQLSFAMLWEKEWDEVLRLIESGDIRRVQKELPGDDVFSYYSKSDGGTDLYYIV